ncbi:MAG: YccF domain-containing protein [Actinomycetota bacterium]
MRTIGNVIWLLFAGLWLALAYAAAALAMFLLIITIPFGVQAIKLASFSLWPFGRTLVKKESAGAGSVLGNLLWLLLAGWWLALVHLTSAIILALTIIGIPFAVAQTKLAATALWPFGREIVPLSAVAGGEGTIVVGGLEPPHRNVRV